MKIVFLNGSSCSGKSTVIKNIMEEKEGYFQLSYDNIKWKFSKYASGKYREDIHEIMRAILDEVCKQKHNIICEVYFAEAKSKFIQIAQGYGYEIVEINLEAEWEVLLDRFKARLAEAEKDPNIRMANRTQERFKKLFDIYQKGKNPNAIVFRTDTASPEEVSKRIVELL
jgi:predicted kinase